MPSHGLAKLFEAVVVLALPERAIGPVSLTAPTKVSGGMVLPLASVPETSRPVSSALIFESPTRLEPAATSAGSVASPGDPLTLGLSPGSPVGRSMNPAAPGPGCSC